MQTYIIMYVHFCASTAPQCIAFSRAHAAHTGESAKPVTGSISLFFSRVQRVLKENLFRNFTDKEGTVLPPVCVIRSSLSSELADVTGKRFLMPLSHIE